MAIKQFTFSFKLNAEELLAYVVEHNIAVNIEAYGTGPKKPQAPQELAEITELPAMLALPGPRMGKQSIQAVIIAFLLRHQEGATATTLRELLDQSGHSQKSFNGQIHLLKQKGLVKSNGHGAFKATPKALKATGASS